MVQSVAVPFMLALTFSRRGQQIGLQAFTKKDGTPIMSSGAWIASITTLNGVNNGTVAVYAVGLSPWSLNPLPLSVLWWCVPIPFTTSTCSSHFFFRDEQPSSCDAGSSRSSTWWFGLSGSVPGMCGSYRYIDERSHTKTLGCFP
jgi:hypothetical protein